jgi:transposase
LTLCSHVVYIINTTMSFIRKIKVGDRTYLAEVESRRIDGKVVQRHIRYVGKEVNGCTVLSSSLSNVEITDVKVYGPLLVLNQLAQEIGLSELIGRYGNEILSLAYAHCLDYMSINQMERWYSRTDLSMMLSLEKVTEHQLLNALDSIEQRDSHILQRIIFQRLIDVYHVPVAGVIYDVTNTYLYGKHCSIAKLGHDKEGAKGRPLIQIGLAITQNHGFPICHKVYDGNIHDAKTLQDFITHLREYKIRKGTIVFDRGIASGQNIADIKKMHWDVVCGLPIRVGLAQTVRDAVANNHIITISNRIRLNKTIFYVLAIPHAIEGTKGTLAICFNEQQKRDLHESRYDEIINAQKLLREGKEIKAGLEKYFSSAGKILEDVVHRAEEFDGFSCIFSTSTMSKEDLIHLYFDKDIVEKAFRTIKGIARLQPIRHWLYNRVKAHVFICYLSYLLLSLLQNRLKKIGISAEEALIELETMYKVYLRDSKKGFKVDRVVTLSKRQELILKTVDKRLLNCSV